MKEFCGNVLIFGLWVTITSLFLFCISATITIACHGFFVGGQVNISQPIFVIIVLSRASSILNGMTGVW